MTAQATQCQEVSAVGIRCPHPDQRHKKRDQRGGAHKNQRCHPVHRENGDHDQQRNEDGKGHLRQIARVVVMHIVNLLKDQRRPATGRFTLDPRGPGFLKPVEHLTADLVADVLSGVKTDALTQPNHPGAKDKNQDQDNKGQQERFAGNVLHDHVIKNAGQQPCLGNNQQTADETQNTGNRKPAAGKNALLFQPAC